MQRVKGTDICPRARTHCPHLNDRVKSPEPLIYRGTQRADKCFTPVQLIKSLLNSDNSSRSPLFPFASVCGRAQSIFRRQRQHFSVHPELLCKPQLLNIRLNVVYSINKYLFPLEWLCLVKMDVVCETQHAFYF